MLSQFMIAPLFDQANVNEALNQFKFKVPLTDAHDFKDNVEYLLNQQSANDPSISYDFNLTKESVSSPGFLAALQEF